MEGPRIFGSLCSTSRSRLGLKLPSKVCDRWQPQPMKYLNFNTSQLQWYHVVPDNIWTRFFKWMASVPNRMFLWIDLTDMRIRVWTQLIQYIKNTGTTPQLRAIPKHHCYVADLICVPNQNGTFKNLHMFLVQANNHSSTGIKHGGMEYKFQCALSKLL